MKQKITFFLVMMCLFSISTYAQTQFWSDTFEDTGAPSTGVRTPSVAEFSCGGPPATAYFMRTATTGIAFQNGAYTAIEGSKFWAAEDIDKGSTCTNNSISANQQVTWSGINITGKTGLSFRGLFAASNFGGWQGIDFGAQQDFLSFEYRIDGGAWVRAIAFYSDVPLGSAASSNTLRLDTNNDMVGDGTSLGLAFTDYSVNIVGTGTTLDIRMNCFANAGAAQELAVDNFRLFEAPLCNVVLTANSQTNISCNGGSNGAASVNTPTGGTAPYTYNWTPGNPTGDGTTSVTGLTAGTWICTVTDANGCTASQNFTVTQPTALSLTPAAQTNIACNGGATGAATVNAATGGSAGYTYNWTPGNPTGDGTTSVTGLTAGTWTCTVTDANGCSALQNFTVTQPTTLSLTPASQTNIACNGGATGAATVNAATGGTAGYTYNWTPGNPTGDGTTSVTGLTAGTWTCTVTDANGCSASQVFTVTQPAAAVNGTTVVTNVSCNSGTNGTINLTPSGGTGPYTFNWGGGITTEDRTGLAAGSYSVTITDSNGCTGTVSGIIVTQPAAVVNGTTVVTNVSCNSGTNGAINLTPSGGTGPYTYNWGGGITTEDRTGLVAGSYSVTITDSNGCTGTVSGIIVTQPSALSLTAASQTDIACNGGSTGAASVNVATGGTAPYTYNWTPGNPTGDGTTSVSGLTAGTWTCTVTDANGCTAIVNFTITEPTAIDNTVTQTAGVLTANQNGATYQWYECPNILLTGETNQSFTPTAAGDYKVAITVGACSIESACETVTVLGSEDFENKSTFAIYPNPTNGLLTIDSNFDGDFIIANQLGQTVKTFKVNSNVDNIIDVENLADGIYFVKGTNGTQITSQRLIIKK